MKQCKPLDNERLDIQSEIESLTLSIDVPLHVSCKAILEHEVGSLL
jgi:hypothetical protein